MTSHGVQDSTQTIGRRSGGERTGRSWLVVSVRIGVWWNGPVVSTGLRGKRVVIRVVHLVPSFEGRSGIASESKTEGGRIGDVRRMD